MTVGHSATRNRHERTGADVLVDVLISEGVDRVFGNPGTTELPLVTALAGRSDIQYVLALHEGTACAMADGYAQATGRPAFLNLHTTTGLGNAMGQLANAVANRTPLVVTAGQQDRRHLVRDPLLSGDLVEMVKPLAKWGHEVRSADELPTILRRAFHDTLSAPTGPVFISLPLDVLDEPCNPFDPGLSAIDRRAAGSIDELLDVLASAGDGQLCFVVDDEVNTSGALGAVVELVEMLGASVHGAPLHGRTVFPAGHPAWAGTLPPVAAAIADALAAYSCVVFLGGQVFLTLHHSAPTPIPVGADLVHITADAAQLGRAYGTRLGLHGDIRTTIEAVLTSLRSRPARRAATPADASAASERHRRLEDRALSRYDTAPLHPMAAVHSLLRALPADARVVDEAITAGPYVRGFHHVELPDRYFSCRGGGLGWGMPAAVGVSLADGGSRVLCIVGDGATMYAPQAMWTAAREGLPVVFAVVNNRQYRILKRFNGAAAVGGFDPVLDLTDPAVDYLHLAASMGLEAFRAETAADVAACAAKAWARPGPTLIEIPIAVLE